MSKSNYANVGGQAVMEGIMMRSPIRDVLAVRKPDGEIAVEDMKHKPLKEKAKFFKLPFIRGVVGFIDSMIVGYKSLMRSAEIAGIEEEKEEKDGKDKGMTALLIGSALLGVALAVALFIFLPAGIIELIQKLAHWTFPPWAYSVVKGVLRIAVLLIYILLISTMKDIKRLFQYHGAEHKTIFCFEHREELTVENVKKYSRLHPRCGTSFLLIVFLIGIVFSILMSLIPFFNNLITSGVGGRMLYTLISILFIPLIAGISYEVQRYTGRHENWLTKILSAPGKAFQLFTTREPEDDQIEVAIESLKCALKDENGNMDVEAAYK